jgi:hypothetical protein
MLWPGVAVCLAAVFLFATAVAGGLQARRPAGPRAWVFVENRGARVLRVSLDGAEPVAVAPGRHASFSCRPGDRAIRVDSDGECLLDGTQHLGEGSMNYYVLEPTAPGRR